MEPTTGRAGQENADMGCWSPSGRISHICPNPPVRKAAREPDRDPPRATADARVAKLPQSSWNEHSRAATGRNVQPDQQAGEKDREVHPVDSHPLFRDINPASRRAEVSVAVPFRGP